MAVPGLLDILSDSFPGLRAEPVRFRILDLGFRVILFIVYIGGFIIGYILGVYRDNEKEHGNCYLIQGLGFSV